MIYPKRYELEPRKRTAYCNAFDLIAVYGADFRYFNYARFDLTETEAKEIWETAANDVKGTTKVNRIYVPRKAAYR